MLKKEFPSVQPEHSGEANLQDMSLIGNARATAYKKAINSEDRVANHVEHDDDNGPSQKPLIVRADNIDD